MKRILLRSVVVLLVVVLLPVAYFGLTLFRASGGLPQWDGDLQVPGLDAQVEVIRDQNGIPFIEAATERDLYFAQGFVHAQDRFWQMALTRHAMAGRLAEWMGTLAVRSDRIARMWGWHKLAQQSLEALPNDDRELMEAYAQGVNAWLNGAAYRRPPEMVILHIKPERWRAEDGFLIGYSMHQLLAGTGSEQGRARFGSEAYDILDETVLPVPAIISPAIGHDVFQPTAAYKSRTFSDNWTISGEHTDTGKPLMANDPQLAISLPGVWHLQHHTVGTRRMAGGTLPGLPGIVVGHNGKLAWGITNAMLDAADLVFLQVDADDPLQYRRGPSTDWQEFQQRSEEIVVRFGGDFTETVRKTPQGIVWPIDLDSAIIGSNKDRTLEIRDVVLEQAVGTAFSFVQLNRASNVTEGIAAVRGLNAPAVNISLADDEGNIGYVMAGRIPLRPISHATHIGQAPEDGNEWQLLPFDANPQMLNPTGGRIVTANQRIVGDEYPYYLTDRWAAPYRARRIHEMLDLREQHDVDSFVAMQMDQVSPVARELTPLMLKVTPATKTDEELVSVLQDWDYRFSLDSAAPLIWMTWVDELRQRMLEDELDSFSLARSVVLYSPLIRALTGERAEWCDDITTDATEDCDELLQKSLAAARQKLTVAFGSDADAWQWGQRARFRIPHRGFAQLPVLGRIFSRETVIPGGPESLFMNGIVTEGAPEFSATTWSSSYQGIYDLSDLDSSRFMTTGGSSGHFDSPYYNNLTEHWIDGQRMQLNPNAISASAELALLPGRTE